VQRLDVDDPESIELPSALRVLVNNARIERDYLPVEHVPIDQGRDVFETNVFGLVEVTRRAIPILRANCGGVICNVTSSSILVPVPFYAVYRASKAAVSPSWARWSRASPSPPLASPAPLSAAVSMPIRETFSGGGPRQAPRVAIRCEARFGARLTCG
jgi:hypothetical protein